MGYMYLALILTAVWGFSDFGKIHAYLDPGSGSYFIQLLLASLMGGLFALGVFRKRVITYIRKLLSSRNNDQNQNN